MIANRGEATWSRILACRKQSPTGPSASARRCTYAASSPKRQRRDERARVEIALQDMSVVPIAEFRKKLPVVSIILVEGSVSPTCAPVHSFHCMVRRATKNEFVGPNSLPNESLGKCVAPEPGTPTHATKWRGCDWRVSFSRVRRAKLPGPDRVRARQPPPA